MAGEGGWDEAGAAGFGDRKLKNTLPLYGNKNSMNLNSMILTNILGSAYFKEELITYKTYHEVIDQIYYKVEHLEPWEKNSRKLAGQVGMCAGVRGVAAGGIVSTAYCLLFKLFTLKLTRKQLTAMLVHKDSPYIRGIGFMYIRYSQPPADFWDWFSPYLEDEEEIDLKVGGGYVVTIGEMCRMMISKLDWFGTLFPRLPVNVQKSIESKLQEFRKTSREVVKGREANGQIKRKDEDDSAWGEAGRRASLRSSPVRDRSRDRRVRSRSREQRDSRDRGRRSPFQRGRSRSRERRHSLSRDRRRPPSGDRRRSPNRRPRSRSRNRRRRSRSRERRHSRSRDQVIPNFARRSRSRSRDRARRRSRSRERRGRSRSPFRRR